MNFQQLRIIRETARRNYNLTEVANALYTSQSGVSKHIRDLEDELGVQLFVRRGKRLLGLTDPGRELLPVTHTESALVHRSLPRIALDAPFDLPDGIQVFGQDRAVAGPEVALQRLRPVRDSAIPPAPVPRSLRRPSRPQPRRRRRLRR